MTTGSLCTQDFERTPGSYCEVPLGSDFGACRTYAAAERPAVMMKPVVPVPTVAALVNSAYAPTPLPTCPLTATCMSTVALASTALRRRTRASQLCPMAPYAKPTRIARLHSAHSKPARLARQPEAQ